MKAIFLNDGRAVHQVYSDSLKQILFEKLGMDSTVYTGKMVLEEPEKFQNVEYIFSTWGMPGFTEDEIRYILEDPDVSRCRFFEIWTGKESYLKLTGQGIFGGMDNFLVDLEENRIFDNYNYDKEIYLKEYKCLEDYYISVACYSRNFATFVKKIFYKI